MTSDPAQKVLPASDVALDSATTTAFLVLRERFLRIIVEEIDRRDKEPVVRAARQLAAHLPECLPAHLPQYF